MRVILTCLVLVSEVFQPIQSAAGSVDAVIAENIIRDATSMDQIQRHDELYRIRTEDGSRLIYIHCSSRSCSKVYGSSMV
jgi:hypothetical protein